MVARYHAMVLYFVMMFWSSPSCFRDRSPLLFTLAIALYGRNYFSWRLPSLGRDGLDQDNTLYAYTPHILFRLFLQSFVLLSSGGLMHNN